MSKHPLLEILSGLPEYARLSEFLRKERGSTAVFGLGEAHRSHVAAALFEDCQRPLLFVTANEMSAARVCADASYYTKNVCHIPAREIPLGAKTVAASSELTARRLNALTKLAAGERIMAVISAETLLQRTAPPLALLESTVKLASGERYDIRTLAQTFSSAGYERVDLCEGRGQFCVRGGYLDIFPITASLPVRIEFFDDEIDTMRTYDPVSQRSVENIGGCSIPPATETPFTQDAKARGMRALRKLPGMKEEYDQLAQGVMPINAARLMPYLYPETYIQDYLPKGAVILVDEPQRVEESANLIYSSHINLVSALASEGSALPDEVKLLGDPKEIIPTLKTDSTALLFALNRTYGLIKTKDLFNFKTRPASRYINAGDALAADVAAWKRNGYTTLIYAGSHAVRLQDMLIDAGLDAGVTERLNRTLTAGETLITAESLGCGYEYPELHLSVVSETELYGSTRETAVAHSRKKRPQLAFSELSVGDLVVHETHGIGRFVGVEKLTAAGVTRDYLHLVYEGGDKLYIPTDQLDRVQKYVGGEEEQARLSKLGSGDWQRTVSRTRESVKALAFDLVRLYGDRKNRKGHAFSKDTTWQHTLEDSFPYRETQDQLTCIEEIKRDMESESVMDRLLCGDVGYGKTEVALRAAFKAVMDGKQVAMLVPTTILAQQHYNTFASRFAGYPVNVAILSRFNTPLQEKNALEGLAKGSIDIVVGTHKLLAKSVKFRDLGLLIIDEEQRFGVGHKEQMKEMRRSVDCLTLSATPIPRTLHMSMTGIRDMSVIETPPEQRFPVQTYVTEYSDAMAREAILKEIGRGGQVYFVYNRVQGMERFAEYLKQLVPEARITHAHGQMGERALERTMLDFMDRAYDVLLCSTIIESGLDMPNVNTIIVYDADKMGLAQLYQLRGRVGRASRLGYAYLTFMRDKVLTDIAEKRLSAIREFTQFGAGFKIAMRDLEIRGAGNLLGPEQHGHMAAVGYDLYCKIVDGAIREARGEPMPVKVDTVMDIPVSASIPHEYIPREEGRLSMYKRIALIAGREDVYDVQDELIDRYGEIPQDTANLINIALLKAEASKAYIEKLSIKDGEIRFAFSDKAKLDTEKLFDAVDRINGAQLMNIDGPMLIIRRPRSDAKALYGMLPQFVYMLVDCVMPQ